MPTAPSTKVLRQVLIVDDDAVLRRALRRLLAGLELDVHESESGPAALRWLAQSGHVSALIADNDLAGGLTGLEVLEQAQRRHPGVAAFLYTGERLVTVELWREAFITIISKPAPVGLIVRAIESAVKT
jgi:DNA-binding NtrC family response regulator